MTDKQDDTIEERIIAVRVPRQTETMEDDSDDDAEADTLAPISARTFMLGLLSGVGICVAGVVIASLMLGSYGAGLFLATPLVVGITTAYLANRDRDVGVARTSGLVSAAIALGGLALE